MKIVSPILMLSVLLLVGCGKSALYTNLKEREANEMIAILQQRGIATTKTAGEENTWNVSVDNSDFSSAVEVLNDKGYPKDQFETIGTVFKKSGLVSSPLEERVRFMYALSEDIAETLTHISGVVTARVHIVLPENDPYAEKTTPSSAAVFITHLPNSNVEESIREIKYLVTNSIEGLDYDKVTVALFPVSISDANLDPANRPRYVRILSLKLSPDSIGRFWFLIGTLLVFLSVALAGAGYFFWRQFNKE